MIKHIVFWKLKPEALGATGAENAAAIVNRLHELPAQIPEIVSLETGHDFSNSPASWDVCLYSEFRTREDLKTYQDHPAHVRVRDFIGQVVSERAIVDYEV